VNKPPAKEGAAVKAGAAASKSPKSGATSTEDTAAVSAVVPAFVPAGAPAPAPAAAPAVKASSGKSSGGRSSSRNPPPAPPSPPSPTPVSNRFTDRFAPARHVAKPLNDMDDLPRAAHKSDPKLVNAWKTKAGRELSEDELLAMPESEYMNDKQLDFFRARLQKQKDDLLSNAGETTEHLREDTSIVPDPADRATIEEEHALELRTRDRERKLLKKIAQSLGRLETGDYGFCDETGEPIGLARLMARPTATLSLEAQQRRELKQKMFGN
jgi:DnaK suppressor protein